MSDRFWFVLAVITVVAWALGIGVISWLVFQLPSIVGGAG